MQLTGERFAQAFYNAGLPKDLLITLHLTPELTQYAVQHPLVKFVSFTGSVAGGRAVERAAGQAKNIKGVALEVSYVHLSVFSVDRLNSLAAKIQHMFDLMLI